MGQPMGQPVMPPLSSNVGLNPGRTLISIPAPNSLGVQDPPHTPLSKISDHPGHNVDTETVECLGDFKKSQTSHQDQPVPLLKAPESSAGCAKFKWTDMSSKETEMAGPVKEAKSTIPLHKATIKASLPTSSAELMVTPADKDRSGHLGNGDLLDSAIHRVEAKLASTKNINVFADGQDRELGAKEISS